MIEKEVTHESWQAEVVQAAGYIGWRHLHVRRSIGKGKKWATTTNVVGWPDLFLWHPKRAGHAAIEIKVAPDLPTQAQLDVLASLAAAGTLVAVAYPADLDALVAMLQHRTPFPLYEGRVRART